MIKKEINKKIKKRDIKNKTKAVPTGRQAKQAVRQVGHTGMVYSKGKYIRISARKARLVIDLIRGEDVDNALNILNFTNKKAVESIKKVLNSAIANAVNNFELDKKKLFIKQAYVNDAPILKRGRAGSESVKDNIRHGKRIMQAKNQGKK